MKTIILTVVATLAAFFCVVSCSKEKTTPSQISFYLPQDCGVGPVTVTLNGTSQVIDTFFPNSTPTCGQAGTVTFSVPAGNYNMTAKGGNINWNFPVFTISNFCNLYGLTCSGGGTGGGNGNYYYANWTCNGQSQCIADMGANNGTDGPFCTTTDCQAWGNKFIPGAYNCALTITTPPVIGTLPNGQSCFKIGDF